LNEIPLQDLHAEAELKQPDLAYEDALADALVKWFKPVYPSRPPLLLLTDPLFHVVRLYIELFCMGGSYTMP